MLWRALKPNWLALSKLLLPVCFWIICRIIFSRSLLVESKRIIGSKFWGNVGPLPGFGKATTSTSFQDTGKCEGRIQWLIKLIKLVYLEGTFDIRLEYHEFHGPSSILRNLLIYVSHTVLLFWGGSLSSASNGACTLAPTWRSCFGHTVYAVWMGFLSSQQLRCLYLPAEILGLKDYEWPWSIPVCEGLRNEPYCLRYYLCICKLCFPLLKCSFPSRASNCFRDSIYCRFTSWVPSFLPESHLFYTLTASLDQADRCLFLTKWSYTSTAYMQMQ
jgi:hypothetical protein